jgi:ribosomal protein L37AE/L43A
MICPKCGNEMILRYYKSPEEALKDALRYLPPEMIGKPVWYCKKCLAIVPGW